MRPIERKLADHVAFVVRRTRVLGAHAASTIGVPLPEALIAGSAPTYISFMQPGSLPAAHKGNREWPNALQISFSYSQTGKLERGVADVVHFNAAAICVAGSIPAPKAATVEIRMKWPAASNSSANAELVIRGPTTARSAQETTFRVDQYELQLSGQRSSVINEPTAVALNCLA